jgi:GNAT superfamily N-acetyltransferase
VRIDYLAEHPQHVPLLARWHHDEWGPVLAGWSREMAQAELALHTRGRAIPTTVVALEGDELLGSCSLLENDDERIRAWSPWLASLYVRPPARGSGVGRALVRRIEAEAAALGVAVLYLYTSEAMGVIDFYQRLGWRQCDRVALAGIEAVVMATTPRSDA